MSPLEDKLRLRFADKHADWTRTWPRAVAGATWDEDGARCLLLAVDGPLVAARVVDAFVQAQAEGASRVTLAHAGEATPVAKEAAQRLGVALLDGASLPPPAPTVAAPPPAATPTPPPAPPVVAARASIYVPPFEIPDGLVAAMEAGAFAPPVEGPPLVDPGSGEIDESLLAHVDDLLHALEDEPVLPWHGPAPSLDVEPAAVDPMEVLAMPWFQVAHARVDEQVEVMAGSPRAPRGPAFRPTQMPDWGLPWPRPPTPADGLAIADPRIWGARERVRAVHDDLDRKGGGSFGQVRPADGSAWLKRVQTGL